MVDNKLIILGLFIFMLVSMSVPVFASEDDCIYYFYAEGCTKCQNSNGYLTVLATKYPELQLERHEVYYNRENLELLEKFMASYDIPEESQGIPVVFIKNSYLVGSEAISNLLEGRILANDDSSCPDPEDSKIVGVVGKTEPYNPISILSFPIVTAAGLVDSFTPIALVLIVILLFLSFFIYDHEEWLKRSIAYLVGIYLILFIYGLGMFDFMGKSSVSYILSKLLGILSIFLGIFLIVNFFIPNKKLKEWENKAEKVIKAASSAGGTFILGLIFGLLTLGSTGAKFKLIRSLFSESVTREKALPLLIYYGFIYLIPLFIIIVVLFYIRKQLHMKATKKGENDMKIESWKKHHLRVLNFGISAAIIIIGFVILFN